MGYQSVEYELVESDPYPYRLLIKHDLGNLSAIQRMYKLLGERLRIYGVYGYDWKLTFNSGETLVYFRQKESAMLFKLEWQ
jgi:hypothetical protein